MALQGSRQIAMIGNSRRGERLRLRQWREKPEGDGRSNRLACQPFASRLPGKQRPEGGNPAACRSESVLASIWNGCRPTVPDRKSAGVAKAVAERSSAADSSHGTPCSLGQNAPLQCHMRRCVNRRRGIADRLPAFVEPRIPGFEPVRWQADSKTKTAGMQGDL